MPLRCFASLFFAIAAALVVPKEAFRCLEGGAVDWAAGVAPAFSTAAVVQAADAGEIAVAVASPLTASALASACTLLGPLLFLQLLGELLLLHLLLAPWLLLLLFCFQAERSCFFSSLSRLLFSSLLILSSSCLLGTLCPAYSGLQLLLWWTH